MKSVVVAPRLDLTFKEGPMIPQPIPPIREHWARFIDFLAKGLDQTIIKTIPLWTLDDKILDSIATPTPIDIIFLPHRESHQIVVPGVKNMYYMQSVFPWRFYIDSKGFAGGASFYPIDMNVAPRSKGTYLNYMGYAYMGGTKFAQPPKSDISLSDYVLFPCQLPHDVTIKYHSDYSVAQALESTLIAANRLGLKVIVKGHPINPASMVELESITHKYANAIWVENVNIHSLIQNARVVVVVNSGTGMEALLHEKPVVTFGRCEYDVVTTKATPDTIYNVLANSPKFDYGKVEKFFDIWSDLTYDTNSFESFMSNFSHLKEVLTK